MKQSAFFVQVSRFESEITTLRDHLREADRIDPFQELVVINLFHEIISLRRFEDDEGDIPVEAWAHQQWKDAYREVVRLLRTGFGSAMNKLNAEARATASAMMADWLDQVTRYGSGNLLGFSIPSRIE